MHAADDRYRRDGPYRVQLVNAKMLRSQRAISASRLQPEVELQSRPARTAQIAACTRLETPSFATIDDTCRFTVVGLR